MIQTFKYAIPDGTVLDVSQMPAERALELQTEALSRRESSLKHLTVVLEDGSTRFKTAEELNPADPINAMFALLGDNDDEESDPFLEYVTLNGEPVTIDSLFSGDCAHAVTNLFSFVYDINYGFLYKGDMFLGAKSQSGEEVQPLALQKAQDKFSQSRMIYQVCMSERHLATLHDLQTKYNLHDLYKLYEMTAYEQHLFEYARKQAQAANKQ